MSRPRRSSHKHTTDAKLDDPDTHMDMDSTANDPLVKSTMKKASRAVRDDTDAEVRVDMDRVRRHVTDGQLLEVSKANIRSPCKCIIYWMQREQRMNDNWALLYAQQLAADSNVILRVVFCMVPTFLDGTIRQYDFMIDGMKELEQTLAAKHIPFHILLGYAPDLLPPFADDMQCGAIVTDFNPLRIHRQWRIGVTKLLDPKKIPLYQVDAHNVVPMWIASNKQEYGARTIRPKIHQHINRFLNEYPQVQSQPDTVEMPKPIDWSAVESTLVCDRSVKRVDWIESGEQAALANLGNFISNYRLQHFKSQRNDPTQSVLSNISPYLHFGQISAARAILEVNKYKKQYPDSVASFIEEVCVRRELSDNFLWHQPHYDTPLCAYAWASETLKEHEHDEREFLYTLGEFECAVTHDALWNAAQIQMVTQGKMHGFMRMYWAKKMLEWSVNVQQAMEWCIYLNDKYELDGRDPNGYVGIAWSMLGIHDQGWRERAIFGKVRYMNYAGCNRKFNIQQYIAKYPAAVVGTSGFKANQKRAKELDASGGKYVRPQANKSNKDRSTTSKIQSKLKFERIQNEQKSDEKENDDDDDNDDNDDDEDNTNDDDEKVTRDNNDEDDDDDDRVDTFATAMEDADEDDEPETTTTTTGSVRRNKRKTSPVKASKDASAKAGRSSKKPRPPT